MSNSYYEKKYEEAEKKLEEAEDKIRHLQTTIKLYSLREEQLRKLYEALNHHKNQQIDNIVKLLSSLKDA